MPEINRIGSGQINQQAVQGTQGKDPDGAFQDMARSSNGADKEALDKAVSDRTRLTRTKRVGVAKVHKKKNSLFVVDDDGDLDEEPVYRTIMVDGVLFTLRLLAVA